MGRAARSSRPRGFALLEVLIAVLVMAFGMLGIAQLLLVTTRSNASSGMRQQAIQSAYNMVDKIRANRQAAILGEYDFDNKTAGKPVVPTKPTPTCDNLPPAGNVCTPAQMAAYDTWYWLANDVAIKLPSGSGSVAHDKQGNSTHVTITVQWDDKPAQAQLGSAAASDAGSANPNLARFVVETML